MFKIKTKYSSLFLELILIVSFLFFIFIEVNSQTLDHSREKEKLHPKLSSILSTLEEKHAEKAEVAPQFASVSREQMAIFLVKALWKEPPAIYCNWGIPFKDVNAGMWSCRYIKRLEELDITTGYGDGRFGPYDAVTRAQMAVFLWRAFPGM